MIGAGATSGGAMDASNLLKPALAQGTAALHRLDHLQGISPVFREGSRVGASLPEDRRQRAVRRRHAVEIMKGLKPYFEEFHKIRYTNEAIKAAVELSAQIHPRSQAARQGDRRDRRDRREPDAAARRQAQEGDRHQGNRRRRSRRWRASPPRPCPRTTPKCCRTSTTTLKRVVYGQDACDLRRSTSAIKLARAGLRDGEKPIGSYLFSGPTGVGKTEVAKQLSVALGVELIRFDMSEYMERHTVSPSDRRAARLCRLRPGRAC